MKQAIRFIGNHTSSGQFMSMRKQFNMLSVIPFGPRILGIAKLAMPNALDQSGWFASIANGYPCDCLGQPIPWISYPAVSLLSQRVNGNWDIFEYGAGFSTLWWAQRCRSVTSCEHDVEWCKKLQSQLPPNAKVFYQQLNEHYPNVIEKTDRSYDVVLVDGRKRVKCALRSIELLSNAGIVVWDDTDRPYYQAGLEAIRARGFKQLDLVGMSPLISELKQTSILYRARNVLDL